LSSASFLDTLRRLGRAGVKPPTFKLRRYGPDDFFGSHCDGDEGLGLLIHLTDPPWQDGDGGRLIYEPSTGGELQMPPRFNSAVFLPYALSATHRVEPVAPHGAIRYTLGCDYA
jgi:predicted 2-oxoglutarate/Fe(II)-dependent dioxygenase YbiX